MSLVQIETKELTGRKYWRSLNELAGTSQFRDWVSKEFPGGTDMLDGESRRNVLKLMAASFSLAGLAACSRPEEKIVPMSKGVEDLIPGKPFYYNTVFSHGGNAIGLTVEAHDGRRRRSKAIRIIRSLWGHLPVMRRLRFWASTTRIGHTKFAKTARRRSGKSGISSPRRSSRKVRLVRVLGFAFLANWWSHRQSTSFASRSSQNSLKQSGWSTSRSRMRARKLVRRSFSVSPTSSLPLRQSRCCCLAGFRFPRRGQQLASRNEALLEETPLR